MIDLHSHTTASDGVLSPAALVDRAASESIELLSVADHDTVGGLASASAQADTRGIRFVPSIELSVEWKGGDFHLLGYGIDASNGELLEGLRALRSIREARIPRIVERLREAGLSLSLDDVLAEAADAVPGKPHVARAMVKKGISRDFEHAFDEWLSHGRAGDVPKEKITPAEAFRLLRAAGGVPVIAHPITLGIDRAQFGDFLERFKPEGLRGVEAYAELHSDGDVAFYLEAAARAGLIATGGSDFHGDKIERLGCYGRDRVIPDVCGVNLLAALGGSCRS